LSVFVISLTVKIGLDLFFFFFDKIIGKGSTLVLSLRKVAVRNMGWFLNLIKGNG